SDRSAAILGDQVFDAAVAARRNPPLELQIEVVERVDSNDVAGAAGILVVGGEALQPAILDDPAVLGERRLLEAAPPVGRLAVEELPLARPRLCGEHRARRGDQRQNEEAANSKESHVSPNPESRIPNPESHPLTSYEPSHRASDWSADTRARTGSARRAPRRDRRRGRAHRPDASFRPRTCSGAETRGRSRACAACTPESRSCARSDRNA